jgi:hypothetical protein
LKTSPHHHSRSGSDREDKSNVGQPTWK